jgi:hypothetical protein
MEKIEEDEIKNIMLECNWNDAYNHVLNYYLSAKEKLHALLKHTDKDQLINDTKIASAEAARLHLAASTLIRREDFSREAYSKISNKIASLLASHNRIIQTAFKNNDMKISFLDENEDEQEDF